METQLVDQKLKWCPDCKTKVPIELFGAWRGRPMDLDVYCTPHRQARSRKRRRDSVKASVWSFKSNLKKFYNLTIEDYEVLLSAQKDACAICGELPKDRRLAVDHDHVTGKVRGLLCGECNWAIGKMKDNPDRLEAAARYLRRNLRKQANDPAD